MHQFLKGTAMLPLHLQMKYLLYFLKGLLHCYMRFLVQELKIEPIPLPFWSQLLPSFYQKDILQ